MTFDTFRNIIRVVELAEYEYLVGKYSHEVLLIHILLQVKIFDFQRSSRVSCLVSGESGAQRPAVQL